MTDNWVEFKTVKAAVSMHMVLKHYGFNWLEKKGSELRGRCPICKGKDDNPFSANTEKNNFQCFACRAKGNVLDFVAAMEKCSVRDAALKLAEWFSVGGDRGTVPEAGAVTGSQPKRIRVDGDFNWGRMKRGFETNSQLATKKDQTPESGGETTAENKPLTFQLQGVDLDHPYLAERGITPETAAEFGIGFFSGKGSMSGRVVIPIHNERGELLGYAGRSIDGSEPRYKFPSGFHKAGELYNLHRAVVAAGSTVVVVEGFFDCMKVHQAGFPCVALMGSSMSERQEDLLRKFGGVVLLFDGDEAGGMITTDCLGRLGRGMWVKAVVLPGGMQPDMLSVDRLRTLLR